MEVLHRYCRAIDCHDEVALMEVFAEDAIMALQGSSGTTAGSSVSGRDEIVRALAALFPGRSWARHYVSNELVDSLPDGILAVSCYFRFILAENTGTIEGTGDYAVLLVEREGRLVIGSLTVSILERGVRKVM